MKRVKTRYFSGAVCEQVVFSVSEKCKNIKAAKPRIRFRNDEERAHHREQIARRRFQRLINENFTSASYYITLTFNNEYEVHTFDEAVYLRDLYVRRIKRKYPNCRIVIVKGRGKATKRIHLHMVVDGVPREELISRWGYGEVVSAENLRKHNYYNDIDYGEDFTGLANYLFDHWTEEQGGKRYFRTKNLKVSDCEPASEVKRDYSIAKPPRPPKGFMLVEATETSFGLLYFKYVRKPERDGHRKRL